MSLSHATPLQWQVNGLLLTGLSWGRPGAEPVLALHGWLDNAASFAMLAPLLEDCHLVALDLTGHGQSDRRSCDASYQIWDDLPEINGVLEQLGWEQFNLLGHSRGAIISTLLASAFPERIKHLVLLDALMPAPLAEQDCAVQIRSFLQDKKRLLGRDTRIFATVDDAVDARKAKGLPPDAARLLVERNLKPCAGGFTWTTDPRLRGASAIKLTAGQHRAVLEALDMPTLLLVAQEGLGRVTEIRERAQASIRKLVFEKIDGGHHFHMEPGVEGVARRIGRFLNE